MLNKFYFFIDNDAVKTTSIENSDEAIEKYCICHM